MPALGFRGKLRHFWRRFRKLPENVVELTGGARFNQRGERNPKKYRIDGLEHVVEGGEGSVHRVRLRTRGRWVTMMRKRFHFLQGELKRTGFGIPEHHFELLMQLKRLNKKENLGLHLPNTIRIEGRGKHASIWTTPIEEIKQFQRGEFEQYDADCKRQIAILEKIGYAVGDTIDHLFIPTRTKEGNVIGVLIDVGHVFASDHPEQDRYPLWYSNSV